MTLADWPSGVTMFEIDKVGTSIGGTLPGPVDTVGIFATYSGLAVIWISPKLNQGALTEVRYSVKASSLLCINSCIMSTIQSQRSCCLRFYRQSGSARKALEMLAHRRCPRPQLRSRFVRSTQGQQICPIRTQDVQGNKCYSNQSAKIHVEDE